VKPALCPHCGYDIEMDMPVLINDFSMTGAGYPLFYRGLKVELTHGEALVCWSLMKNFPHYVTKPVLMERIGSDSDDDNMITILVSRIRRKFREMGAPNAIATIAQHRSYAWSTGGGLNEVVSEASS
jgi:DNA-binding response OmpR family regulator